MGPDHEGFGGAVEETGAVEAAVHVQTTEDAGVGFENGECGRAAKGVADHRRVSCVEAGVGG